MTANCIQCFGKLIPWKGLIIFQLIQLLLLVSSEMRDRDTILFQHPLECNSNQNETFSTSVLSCVKCHWIKGDTSGEDCPCPRNHKELISFERHSASSASNEKCSPCENGTAVYDNFYCLSCGEMNPFDDTTGKCKLCPAGHIQVVNNIDGSTKGKVECSRCASGFTPDSSSQRCVRCHPSFVNNANGTCRCPELTHNFIDGVCFTNAEISNPQLKTIDRKQVFRIEYESSKLESLVFRDNVISAFYLCKERHNETACQLLTNLCTLNLHSFSEEWSACRLYISLFSGPMYHPPAYVPKLYYSEAPSVLIKSSAVPHVFDMDFSKSTSDINITVSRISMEGHFLGLSSLYEMTPCTDLFSHQRLSQKFGSTYKSSCSIPIQDLWKKYAGRMEFIEPFVSHESPSENKKNSQSKLNLYSIPIKILNFKKNQDRSNMADDRYQWQLVRRFFFVDIIGGFGIDKDDSKSNVPPNRVRYADSVSVSVQLQNDKDPGKIYVPLISVSYKEISKEEFLQNEVVEFTYTVKYFMDMSRSLEDVKISIGVMSALAVIWAALQAWSHNRRNGKVEIDIETIFHLLFISCGHLADAFFIVCFSTSLYWLLFFKEQKAVHVMLPQSDQEFLIRDLLISAFSLKIVDVIRLVGKQVNVDVFFVDWERPRARNTIQPPNETLQNDPSIKKGENAQEKNSEGNVSIWRTYFIANEWNEIQAIRKIHIPSQIILTIFFLEIVGFKHWGLHWPDGSLNPGPEAKNIPYSTVARFAVGSFVFGLIGICQWLYTEGFYERFITNRIHDFVDVCTLANISVFILAAKQQGYYIHGRSVHGFADTDMQTMIEQLSREEEDLCGRRGLLPSTDQQTFLIFVPSTFRSVYNQVLQPLYASSSAHSALLGKGRLLSGASKTAVVTKPTANMINLSILAYHSMNRFLTAFLEHALSDLDYDVTDKSFFESTLDMEFSDVSNDRAVFYTDNGHSFDTVLFHGNERTLFMFDLYIFLFVDILSHNFVLAGIVTFIADLVVKKIRSWLGRRNLAQKTLIDARFLI